MTKVNLKCSLYVGLAVILCALLRANVACAQAGSYSAPSRAPAELYIRNTTGQAIIFSAAVDDSAFTPYTVEAGNTFTISCQGSGCDNMHYFHIQIDSNIDGRIVTKRYSESPGTRIQIAWNSNDRCWDFFKDN